MLSFKNVKKSNPTNRASINHQEFKNALSSEGKGTPSVTVIHQLKQDGEHESSNKVNHNQNFEFSE